MTTPQRDFARELRRRQTSTEDLLWQQLRGRRLGHKFRRQVPVSRYTVDFLCFAAKLVVEIDGAQHAATAEYDAARTAEIEAQGLRVIRFTNREIREQPSCASPRRCGGSSGTSRRSPSPHPSRRGDEQTSGGADSFTDVR